MLAGILNILSSVWRVWPYLIFLVLPILYVVSVTWKLYSRNKSHEEQLRSFGWSKKHWLLGHIPYVSRFDDKGLAWLVETARQFPRCAIFWRAIRPVIMIHHPDTLRTVIKHTTDKSVNVGTYKMLRPWLGDGLLMSSGEKWFRNRRLLTPAFHFDVLKPYMDVYNEATNIFLSKLAEASSSGQSVEITQHVCLSTLNIILRCAFSSDVDVQRRQEKHPYVQAVVETSYLIPQRYYNILLASDFIYGLTSNGRRFAECVDIMHDMARSVIKNRKQTLKEEKGERKRYLDFLDILLLARDENGIGLTDEEMQNEVDTFLFEGHDTTASALSWIMYTMAQHPKHQEMCRQEILSLLGDREDKNMTWDDLPGLAYTTQCIKEAMRIHCPVPAVGRMVTEEFELEGTRMTKDMYFFITMYGLHHNESIWGPDHMEFKPERFNEKNSAQMDPYAYIPFSVGSRNCIGQKFAMHEIKVITAKVLNRFHLRVDTSHPVEHASHLVMRSKNGIKLFLDPI